MTIGIACARRKFSSHSTLSMSMWFVGSSSSSTSGSLSSSFARPMRIFHPPLKVETAASLSASAKPMLPSMRSTFASSLNAPFFSASAILVL